MNTKYVMIMGLAFCEENDMKRLKKYAKNGWILEDIVGGTFYKLKKHIPKDIDYSLDYQLQAEEEYFDLFLKAGWTRVVSVSNVIHIFSAPEGTKPIYSDRESVIDKYERVKKQFGKWSVYSLIALIVFRLANIASGIYFKPVFLITSFIFIISLVSFVFTFMPYLAYSNRLRKLRNSNSYI